MLFGPKSGVDMLDEDLSALTHWAERRLGGTLVNQGRLVIDPSDRGRPVVGASAIPGGFYTRGNGRGELVNGTASGCYLAALLLGSDATARGVSLPLTSRLRAGVRMLRHRGARHRG